MNLDFSKEATAFSRANGCPPACIIQKAMERGAELALEQVINMLQGETELRHKLGLTGLKAGERNGT